MDVRWTTGFFDRPGESFGSSLACWQAITATMVSPTRGEFDQFSTLIPATGDA